MVFLAMQKLVAAMPAEATSDDLDVWMQTQQENHRLREAVVACVAVAKGWHAADDVWEIYYNHSPEMK